MIYNLDVRSCLAFHQQSDYNMTINPATNTAINTKTFPLTPLIPFPPMAPLASNGLGEFVGRAVGPACVMVVFRPVVGPAVAVREYSHGVYEAEGLPAQAGYVPLEVGEMFGVKKLMSGRLITCTKDLGE